MTKAERQQVIVELLAANFAARWKNAGETLDRKALQSEVRQKLGYEDQNAEDDGETRRPVLADK